MLCCLVGGLLAGVIIRAARKRQSHSLLLAMAFGFGAGGLVVELVISLLVPLGAIEAPGALPARLGLLIVPALLAVGAGLGGAAGSLLNRLGMMTVASGAVAGSLTAESLDLHLWNLHTGVGLVASIVIHAPIAVFIVGGLVLHSKLPVAGVEGAACECGPGTGTEAETDTVRNSDTVRNFEAVPTD